MRASEAESSDPTAAIPELVVAAHGAVVDVAAAKRCGATAPTSDTARAPSQVSLRLFQPAGRAMLESFGAAWHAVFASDLVPSSDLAIVSALINAQTVVRVALSFGGSVNGRVQIYARPEALIPRPAALAAIKANARLVANVLANVQVEVVVELGTLRMPL